MLCVPGCSSKLLCPGYLPIFRRATYTQVIIPYWQPLAKVIFSTLSYMQRRSQRLFVEENLSFTMKKNTKVHNCFKCKVRWGRNKRLGSFVFLYVYLNLYLYLYLYPYSPLLFVFVVVFCCLHCVCVPKFLDCNA